MENNELFIKAFWCELESGTYDISVQYHMDYVGISLNVGNCTKSSLRYYRNLYYDKFLYFFTKEKYEEVIIGHLKTPNGNSAYLEIDISSPIFDETLKAMKDFKDNFLKLKEEEDRIQQQETIELLKSMIC